MDFSIYSKALVEVVLLERPTVNHPGSVSAVLHPLSIT